MSFQDLIVESIAAAGEKCADVQPTFGHPADVTPLTPEQRRALRRAMVRIQAFYARASNA